MTSWSTSGIYSTVFEDRSTITELIPVRNVYPLSGFRILIAAYAKAMSQNEGLDTEEFVVGYCSTQFGFNKKEALHFWKAIQGLPYEIIDGKVRNHEELTVKTLLDSSRIDQKILDNLKPQTNADEYEHFKLMKDIRVNYLAFKQIETIVNSKEFKKDNIPEVLAQLEDLMSKDDALKVRFTSMNKDLLYANQINEENRVRIERVNILYERLKK
jgi:hypothetical protein